MRRALEQARRGLGRTTPNPIVGACIVTDDGVVVGDGAHERAGEPHAEVHALNEAGARARGATLYCTLEPCSHTGRTGPCTERIIAAGIRRVVAAMEDPFPLVSGRGFTALRAHGIDVHDGLEREAALRLNQPFLMAVRERRRRASTGESRGRRACGRHSRRRKPTAGSNTCGRRWTRSPSVRRPCWWTIRC
jgi:diaminohydroxyphosphoribosylaminopyrimidine deaminase/5-amino-6-(5-phosphoribosylamino)uracil reductase